MCTVHSNSQTKSMQTEHGATLNHTHKSYILLIAKNARWGRGWRGQVRAVIPISLMYKTGGMHT